MSTQNRIQFTCVENIGIKINNGNLKKNFNSFDKCCFERFQFVQNNFLQN